MCSHAQSILLFPTKESLAIYYLRSLCLCAFAPLAAAICLCRKASAGRHPVDCGLASVLTLPRRAVFCLLFSTGWSLIVRIDPHLCSADLFIPTMVLLPSKLLEFFFGADELNGAVV